MIIQIDTLSSQLFNVFQVSQITPGTFLNGIAGLDYIEILPEKVSEVHIHRDSDAIIFVIAGEAKIVLDDESFYLSAGMRVVIPKGVAHGFSTTENRLQFVSIQIPPIQDNSTGRFDREIVP